MNLVWIVSNYPNQYNTGAGIFHLQITRILVKNGHKVTVIAPTPYSNRFLAKISSKWAHYLKYPRIESNQGVHIIRPRYLALPGQNYRGLTAWLMYYSLRNLPHWKEADIVDAHYAYPYGMVANRLAKKHFFANVVSLHGDDVNIDPFHSKMTMKRFSIIIRNASLVQAVSIPLADKAKMLSERSKIAIFNLGLELKFPKEKFIPSSTMGVIRLLYVGALSADKGMHLILSLLNKNKSWRSEKYEWILIGEGSFSSLLCEYNNVTLLGQKANHEVLEQMKQSHIFVFPSLNEGMPHVLKEAGSIGLPIVSSKVGGIPQLLDNGRRGWVFDRNNLEELESTLKQALDRYDFSLLKARLLQDFVYENYNINRNVEDLVMRYKNIIRK